MKRETAVSVRGDRLAVEMILEVLEKLARKRGFSFTTKLAQAKPCAWSRSVGDPPPAAAWQK